MNKQKKNFRINFIDCVITVLVFVTVGATVYFFAHNNGVFTRVNRSVEYELKIAYIESDLADNLSVNDILYDQSTAFEIGTVKSIHSEPPENGINSLTLTIKASAEEHDGILSINGVPIKAGETINFRNPDLCGTATCISVSILPEEKESEK